MQRGFQDPREIIGDRLREGSLYRLLADHGHEMFPDGYFADLYAGSVKGQPAVAARVMAVAMILQSFEGLSGRERTGPGKNYKHRSSLSARLSSGDKRKPLAA